MKQAVKKNLKTTLFIVPTTVILICFLLIFSFFSISVQQYIDDKTSEAMAYEFAFYDSYYDENFAPPPPEKLPEEFIIFSYSIILDADLNTVFPSAPWASEEEEQRTLAIAAYFRNNPIPSDSNTAVKVSLDNKTYYIRAKKYSGVLDDELIIRSPQTTESTDYTVLIYTNITPIQHFLDLLYRTLILLMIVSGSICIYFLFRVARQMDCSINKLKNYILKVGRRETLSENESFFYEEFHHIADTVQNMSSMIDRAENSQKQFFQNASHELKTPLMSIQGYAEGIHSNIFKDPTSAASIIMKESQKMTSLVDEILFLSKMDIGAEKISFETYELKELLYDCSWSIKASADQKNIQLLHEFPEESILLYGDENLLTKVFSNLLSNALRYAQSKIYLRIERQPSSTQIQIEDDGEGIPEKDLPHLFERFYKGEKGNFGIGLAITQDIIHKHHGHIQAQSQNGRTIFTISLPNDEIPPKLPDS